MKCYKNVLTVAKLDHTCLHTSVFPGSCIHVQEGVDHHFNKNTLIIDYFP